MENSNNQPGQYSRNQEKRQSQFVPNITIFNNHQLNPILSENESDASDYNNNKNRNSPLNSQQISGKNVNKPKNPLLEQFINENRQNNVNNSANSQSSQHKHVNLSNSQHIQLSNSPQPSDFYQSLNNINDLRKWDVNDDENKDDNMGADNRRITIIKQMHNPQASSKKVIIIASIVLIIGVFSGSSLGPFFLILPTPAYDSQIMKSLYRQQMMIFLNIILVFYEYTTLKKDKFNSTLYTVNNLLNKQSNLVILMGAICWSFYIMLVPIAVAQANLEIYVFQAFLGIYPCLQVLYKISQHQRCSIKERVGLVFSLISYIYLICTTNSFKGSAYAILAGVFFTIYVKIQSVYRDYYPEFMALLINSIYSTIFLTLMCLVFVESEVSFSKLVVFSDQQDMLTYLLMGIMTGAISSVCFHYSKPILSRQITYAIRGTFPIFSMIIAYLFGTQEMVKDIQVWFILLCIVISYFLISSGKTESENLDIEISNKLTSIQEYENNQPQYYIELQAINSFKKQSSLN